MAYTIGRGLFVALMLLFAGLMFVALVQCIQLGRAIFSVVLILVTSPVLMLIVWQVVQQGQPSVNNMRLGGISFAAVLGDLFVLTTVVAVVALAWARYGSELSTYWRSSWWLGMTFVVGLGLGLAFHLMGGKADGRSPILDEQLHDSATSWAHNFGVFPAIAGALLATIIPLFTIRGGWIWAAVATVICLGGWGGLVALDELRRRLDPSNPYYFDPHWLDTIMDWSSWRPRV